MMKLPSILISLILIISIISSSHASDALVKKNRSNKKINLLKNSTPGELCNRECKLDDVKICHFSFLLKLYTTLSGACGDCPLGNLTACFHPKCIIADGVQRGVLLLNFQLPGPPIHVCKGDMVVIDLHNEAEGLSTTLHFHGVLQKETPWMDGVPYITQCPIPYGSTFRYTFHASDAGTHFYHSHSGYQKIDGAHGVLIVREPNEKLVNKIYYDFDFPEHVIFAVDWMHQMADNHLPGMIKRTWLSRSVLINGRGRFVSDDETKTTFDHAPWQVFNVQSNSKYRFRLINSAMNVCPLQFQIENHNFTVIATEASEVEPIRDVDTLHFLSGERYDIVIEADQPPREYWIRIKELKPCMKIIEGFAILRYHQEGIYEPSDIEFGDRTLPNVHDDYPMNKVFNSLRPGLEHVSVTEARAYDFDGDLIETEPDYRFNLMVDTPNITNDVMYSHKNIHEFQFVTADFNKSMSFVASINNITFEFPSFPLLTEPDRIQESIFCNSNNMKTENCMTETNLTVCKCIHRLKVDLNSTVEFLLMSTIDQSLHPMHLHGYKFHVVDSGTFDDSNLSVDDVMRKTQKSAAAPAYKDTTVLSFPGYSRIRFRATNPGFWFFHCHFDWHMPIGMALVVQVGELHEMKKAPKNFPTCHNFQPKRL